MNDGTCPALVQVEPPHGCEEDRASRFERFLRQQRQALVYFLRKRLPTEEDAQDAAQESRVRLLGYRDAQQPDSWRPLLYRIAVNVAHDQARRARSRHVGEHVPYEETFHAEISSDPPQDEQLMRKQMIDHLWGVVRALPERTQEIYLLNRLEGMSYGQVARHCGISASAVEKHMSRALLALRNGLGEGFPDAL